MSANQNVIAVIVNHEFQERYFTDETELEKYLETVSSGGNKAQAMVVSYTKYKALMTIQELVGIYPDFNTVMLTIEQMPEDQRDSIYKNISEINKNAFAKEYFDYFISNRLKLSDDPNFDPGFAELENTTSYKAYLNGQIAYLQELVANL